MKNLFDPAVSREMQDRLATLHKDTPRQWGTMTPAQMLAHLSLSFGMASGDVKPTTPFFARLLGRLVKPFALGGDRPFQKSSPTAPELIVKDDRDIEIERARVSAAITKFSTSGPAGVTSHPHAFFGPLKPEEWAILMYKHTDHHFRQFGV